MIVNRKKRTWPNKQKKIICTSLIYSLVITGQLINPSPVFINFFSNEAGLKILALLWLS